LALGAGAKIAKLLKDFAPQALHLPTEGPLGWAARSVALKMGWPFTTAYHSKFPEFIQARTGLPLSWLYAPVRCFHRPSSGVLCPSPSVHRELAQRGFTNLRAWTHGVDTDVFLPQGKDFLDLPRPIHMYVGRVTVEKNLPSFLGLDLPGSKLVVGSGPARKHLMRRFPQAHFKIACGDAELSRYFSAADVFVFPSQTDTFGLVMLEALASGVPVAAFPVTGPVDVLGQSGAGVLDNDLAQAARQALSIDPGLCRAHALSFSWDRVTEQFLQFLAPIAEPARLSA
jgi:glycosyltransferase involved in cell wall biosynthesis